MSPHTDNPVSTHRYFKDDEGWRWKFPLDGSPGQILHPEDDTWRTSIKTLDTAFEDGRFETDATGQPLGAGAGEDWAHNAADECFRFTHEPARFKECPSFCSETTAHLAAIIRRHAQPEPGAREWRPVEEAPHDQACVLWDSINDVAIVGTWVEGSVDPRSWASWSEDEALNWPNCGPDRFCLLPPENTRVREVAGSRDGWRSMESAPRDGSYFLACGFDDGNPNNDRHFAVTFWHEGLQQFREGSHKDEHNALLYLTHWQPLPAAPARDQDSPQS